MRLLTSFLFAGCSLLLSAIVVAKPLELPEIQVTPIIDNVTDRPYELYIKLPKDYAEHPDKQYPVLYFTDALWHVELLSSSTYFLFEDVILVGISWQKSKKDLLDDDRAYLSRFRDYSIKPSSDPERQAKYRFGQADTHLNFIRNDVFKHIETHYRADPANRTYFGYSLGGLFGAYILVSKPDTFKNYMLGSPSVWNDVPMLSERANKHSAMNANVFITYGTTEEELSEHVDGLLSMLENRKDKSLSVKHLVIDGSHQTAFPMTGVKGITWLSGLYSEGQEE